MVRSRYDERRLRIRVFRRVAFGVCCACRDGHARRGEGNDVREEEAKDGEGEEGEAECAAQVGFEVAYAARFGYGERDDDFWRQQEWECFKAEEGGGAEGVGFENLCVCMLACWPKSLRNNMVITDVHVWQLLN